MTNAEERAVLAELARPFPDKYVHRNPSGGGSYVKHHVVEQRLIAVLGYPPEFERVEIVRGDVSGKTPDPEGSTKRAKEGTPDLTNVIVGVVARMTVEIGGKERVYEDAGDCEEPHNWKTDGQRLKDAMSDAYKRCAMRLGCGLHLWSQDEYFLHSELLKAHPRKEADSPGEAPATNTPKDIGESAPPDSSQGSSERGQSTQETGSGGDKAAPQTMGGSTAPATSQSSPPVDQGAGGGSWELIETEVKAGRKKKTDVLRKASTLALKHNISTGVSWDALPSMTEIHGELAAALELQESLAV